MKDKELEYRKSELLGAFAMLGLLCCAGLLGWMLSLMGLTLIRIEHTPDDCHCTCQE